MGNEELDRLIDEAKEETEKPKVVSLSGEIHCKSELGVGPKKKEEEDDATGTV